MLDFIIPVVAALLLGFVQALVHMFKNRYSKSFVATLAILPAIVCVVIIAAIVTVLIVIKKKKAKREKEEDEDEIL